jgi:hypothetical protein
VADIYFYTERKKRDNVIPKFRKDLEGFGRILFINAKFSIFHQLFRR